MGSERAGRAGVVPHYLVGDALTAVATLTATATGQPAAGVLIAFTDGAARARPRARAAAPRGLDGPPPVLTCMRACIAGSWLPCCSLRCTACTQLRQRGSAGRRAAPAIFGVLDPARQLLRACLAPSRAHAHWRVRMGKHAARRAGTGAIIGTATTNSSGVATQPFAFTLPGNYTLVANVSQADSTQYGLSTASVSPVFVLDQTSMTLTQVRPTGFLNPLARICDPGVGGAPAGVCDCTASRCTGSGGASRRPCRAARALTRARRPRAQPPGTCGTLCESYTGSLVAALTTVPAGAVITFNFGCCPRASPARRPPRSQ